MLRLRLLVGILGAGVALGALLGLTLFQPIPTGPTYPLVDDYVRLVGALHARGESLSVAEARLHGVAQAGEASLIAQVAALGGTASEGTPPDVSAMLVALAPLPEAVATVPPRLAASGRGSGPVAAQRPESSPTAFTADDFPMSGRVAPAKGDASLRSSPTLNGPVLRIIPRGSDIVLLGVEQGQAIEGAEDRWYRVRCADATGYIYFTLVETVR